MTKNTTQSKRQIVKYSMVSILSCLITVYGSAILYDLSNQRLGAFTFLIPFSVKEVNLNKLFSQVVAMGASFLSNYILHKQFTFRDTGFYDRLKQLLGI